MQKLGSEWSSAIFSGPYRGSINNQSAEGFDYLAEDNYLGWDYIVLQFNHAVSGEIRYANLSILCSDAAGQLPTAEDDTYAIAVGSSAFELDCVANDFADNPVVKDKFLGRWKYIMYTDVSFGLAIPSLKLNGLRTHQIGTNQYETWQDENLMDAGRFYAHFGTNQYANTFSFASPDSEPFIEDQRFQRYQTAEDDYLNAGLQLAACEDCGYSSWTRTSTAAQIEIISPPEHGTIESISEFAIFYTPDQGYAGTDQITYRICNFNQDYCSQNATINIQIGAPQVNDDFQYVSDLGESGVRFLSNDILPDDYEVVLETEPQNGTIDLQTQLYNPNYNFAGLDSFEYKICFEDDVACQSAWSVLEVISPNTIIADEDSENYVLIECYEQLEYTFKPSHEQATYHSNLFFCGIQDGGINPYSPETYGSYYIFDYALGNAVSKFYLHFDYDPEICEVGVPIASDDYLVQYGGLLQILDPLENDELSTELEIISPPEHGTANWDPNNLLMSYSPPADYLGEDCLEYSISNPAGSDTAEVCVFNAGIMPDSILCGNSLEIYAIFPDQGDWQWEVLSPEGIAAEEVFENPNALNTIFNAPSGIKYDLQGSYNGEITAAFEVELLLDIPNPDPLTYCIGDPDLVLDADIPEDVSIQWLNTDLEIDNIFSPTTTVTGDAFETPGEVQIEMQLYGSVCESSSSLIQTIVVSLCGDTPVTEPDFADNCFGGILTIPILENDDIVGQEITVAVETQPSNGTLSIIEQDGSWVAIYSPAIGYVGSDEFEYIVTNTLSGNSATETVNISIFGEETVDFQDDCCLGFPCTINAVIPDGTSITFYESDFTFDDPNSLNPTFSTAGLEADQTYLIAVEVEGLNCTEGTFSYGLSLPLCNQIPVASDDLAEVCMNETIFVPVAENDQTFGEQTSVEILLASGNGQSFVDQASNEIIYTPDDAFTGADSLQYQICVEGSTLCSNAWLNLLIDDCVSNQSIHETEISIFPNPSNGHFSVQSQEPIMQMSLLNTSGQILELDINNNQKLELPAGIYLLDILTSTSRQINRIVIH